MREVRTAKRVRRLVRDRVAVQRRRVDARQRGLDRRDHADGQRRQHGHDQGGGAAFESYQQGLFNNRIFLRKADGSVFDMNGGFNQIGGGDGKVAYEYIFVEVPGKPTDYQLVYETPSKVLTLPLEFEFRDVPLP